MQTDFHILEGADVRKKREWIRHSSFFVGATILFLGLPTLFHAITAPETESSLKLLNQLFLAFLTFILLVRVLHHFVPSSFGALITVTVAGAIYWTIQYVFLMYWFIVGSPFSFASIASSHDAFLLLVVPFGIPTRMSAALVILLIIAAFSRILYKTAAWSNALPLAWITPKMREIVGGMMVSILMTNLTLLPLTGSARGAVNGKIQAAMPLGNAFHTEAEDNIFILQLESVNALAIDGYATQEAQGAFKKYMPTIVSIAKEHGILFPYFWGNSVTTERGQQAILCGISNNMEGSFSDTDRLPELTSKCLPEVLLRTGYETIFLSASDNPGFANTEVFMKKIGFKETHFADMMKKDEDRKYAWGYDDCQFYGRSFDGLKQRFNKDSQKLFVFASVVGHHVNFDPKPDYAHLYEFPEAKSYAEKYLNSMKFQDYCVSEFMKGFEEFRENSHLIIVGDHSYPVGMNGSTYNIKGAHAENFLTVLAYVPPRGRESEFDIGKVIRTPTFAQTDILPTLIELLNGKYEQNSFAFALKKEKSLSEEVYESCHILSQPYSEEMSIVQGNEKFNFDLKTGLVTQYYLDDLKEKFPRTVGKMTYEEFYTKYFCKRYL